MADTEFEAALTRLYRAEFPALYRYLDRQSGDPQLASDLVQEAFVRLFERGEMPEEPRAWLITVVNNLRRDDLRRAGRRLRLLEGTTEPVASGAAAEDASRHLESAERREQVRATLDRLAPRERQILLLRHSGYSYREIGLALDLAAASVGTILLRASARFRTIHEELHGQPD